MEASEATTGIEEGAGGETGGGQEETSGPDYGPVMDRINEVREELTGRFDQMQQGGEGEGSQEELDPITALFATDEADAAGDLPDFLQDPAAQNPQIDPQHLLQAVQQAAQQTIAPFVQQQQEAERDREAAALEEQYPELQDEKIASQVVQESVQLVTPMAVQLAQQIGNPEAAPMIAEMIGKSPAMAEMVYKASKADMSAAQETPAGADEGEAALETGAGPAQNSGGDDANRVFSNSGRSGVSDEEARFWGF